MAESGSTIYLVHEFGGPETDPDEYFDLCEHYDLVKAAFTTLAGAVSFIEQDLGAIERTCGPVRVWRRWHVRVYTREQYCVWPPAVEREDGDCGCDDFYGCRDGVDCDDEELDEVKPSHPFDYVFSPSVFSSYNIVSMVLDSKQGEQFV